MIQDAYNRITQHNTKLFDSWSEESAYLLGYIEADGHIINDKRILNSPSIGIQFACSEKDASFLHHIKKVCGYTGKTSIKTHKLRDGSVYKTHGFTVRSRFWKPHIELRLRQGYIPDIPDSYLHHYIRGYFDGDGSIYYDRQPQNYKSSFVFSSETLAQSFRRKILDLGIKVSNVHRKSNSKRCWYFQLSYKQTEALGRYMYKSGSMYMFRKRQCFIRQLELGG